MAEKDKSHIFFGAIDLNKKKIDDELEAAKASGHVFGEGVGVVEQHTIDSRDDKTAAEMERVAAERQAFDLQKLAVNNELRAKEQLSVPTNDKVVKERLRELGQPVCMFGEGPYERRDRLRGLMSGEKNFARAAVDPTEEETSELFFTEGTPQLKEFRTRIAHYSLLKSRARLKMETQTRIAMTTDAENLEDNRSFDWIQSTMVTECSQVGDSRPLTQGKFSHDGELFCTSSWTGQIKLWNGETGAHLRTFKGHKERCNGIGFRNHAASGSCGLASAGSDAEILLWNLENGDEPLATITGHEERVNRVVFHPQGQLLGSTSHDATWRLWDVEKKKEILLQEGHSRPTYGIAFHPDGSLVATSDVGGICRLWDLRTGRTIMPLVGHHKQVLCLDFHPGGSLLATASDDNSVKLWDLRKRKCATNILAHHKLISEVKFEPIDGKFLMTASYDNTVKLWSTSTYECIKGLIGHEARIMGADITGLTAATKNQYRVGTAAYDRTFKLWSTSGNADSL